MSSGEGLLVNRRQSKIVSTQLWLIQMVRDNRVLARRAHRYALKKNSGDYAAYLQVLKLIRGAKIFSSRTNATNLSSAFIRAFSTADI